jgi:hypothetical protein
MWHGCRFLFLFFLVFRVVKINFKNKKRVGRNDDFGYKKYENT